MQSEVIVLEPDERESHLAGPGGHDLPDGLLAGVGEGAPQVLGQRVLVGVLREVRVHPATEGVVADEVVLHRVGPSGLNWIEVHFLVNTFML